MLEGSIRAIFPDVSLGTQIEPAPATTLVSPSGLASPVRTIEVTRFGGPAGTPPDFPTLLRAIPGVAQVNVAGLIYLGWLAFETVTLHVGLLRTVGTTRRQVWAMVCGESVIIAVTGSVAIAADRAHYQSDLLLNASVIAATSTPMPAIRVRDAASSSAVSSVVAGLMSDQAQPRTLRL